MTDDQKPGPTQPPADEPVREQTPLEKNVKSQSTWFLLRVMTSVTVSS